MQPPPSVSVVLPTYDRTTLLREAAESVIRQTWTTWELLVVDDGSTTPVEDWLPSDPRVHVLHLAHSGNIARVRNVGLGAATGVYVAFLDSDDIWDRRKLELQVARLESSHHAGWCHAAYDVIGEGGNQAPFRAGLPYRPREGLFPEAVLTTEAGITLQTIVVRRELAQAVGFDERIFVEDYDFLVQLALRSPAVAVDECLSHIREHDQRMTHLRYDHGLGSAITYRKAHRQLRDRRLRRVCRRQGFRLLRHYLANARARGHLWRDALHACRALLAA